ncbi:tail fiber protein [Tamlana sp. 62-3]|uniref:Tail fiber protein n=1 Tax=Neotamlana sargassicola TaxID=2883125 RepID=A0A9X1I8E7_9FLAO|nr:tail fiber protein [Tamlana sargassicola]MCB4808269.1 tail fiber protein [Tamlana sargassicola]
MKTKLNKFLFIITLLSTIVSFSQDGFIGEIRLFAGNFAPRNWAFCNGQLLAISSNSALFSILGTTYGGDGRTTFGLPDLRGRVPVGVGSGPGLTSRLQGAKFGSETTTLSVGNLPVHNHAVNASTNSGTSSEPTDNVLAHTNNFDTEYTDTANTTMSETMVGNTGNGEAFNISPPSIGMHYIICTTGTYPSRP